MKGALLVAALLCAPLVARAHPLAPAYLALEQDAGGPVRALFKRSLRVAGPLRPRWPAGCAPALKSVAEEAGARLARFTLDCGGRSLVGATLGVEGLEEVGVDALLRVQLADGRVLRALIKPGGGAYRVPPRTPRWRVALDYLRLGADHLATGWDHLLFVAALLWIVPGLRRRLWTLSAFTLGHSVTLCLAALGVLRVPQAPVEVAIALTLLGAALEVAVPSRAGARFSWGLAAGFGLVHGLGFAGALAETGLPEGEVPLALAAFNLGIELGQLALALAWAGCARAVKRHVRGGPTWWRGAWAYGSGGLAAMWVVERALGALS